MLVEQHHAPFCLAFAGEEFPPNLGKAEQSIVAMDGLQNGFIPLGQVHGWRLSDALIPWHVSSFWFHATSIEDERSDVSQRISRGLDIQTERAFGIWL